MPPSFAGPHHCLGTARRVSDEVFAEISDAAARQGGTLTLQQIEALKTAYDEAAPQRFRAIECIFNTCMCAAAKESMPKAFDEVELVSRFLYAHTSGIAWAVFESRFERPDRAWLAEFYRVLARFVVGRFDPDFPPRAIAVYIEAGQQKGQALSVCDLVQSEQGRAAVHECLLRIMAEPVTPQLAAELCAAITDAEAPAGAPKPAMTVEEAERFLTLLRHAKPVRAQTMPASCREGDEDDLDLFEDVRNLAFRAP
ncbi:hypothetical protein [Blastochloris sulfoviridis]|uniref:Uncharacterized protein n=1 Tax=Blastochloris sulfoviridis TaxID=50712 RepID=A0A5M6I744_9HYPH|nr:hypothetical protein [Blastochloris sulfoviridis]KAA5603655.1 hypothetical protein F1193_00765 [Blastochloris sulfoviridis]